MFARDIERLLARLARFVLWLWMDSNICRAAQLCHVIALSRVRE